MAKKVLLGNIAAIADVWTYTVVTTTSGTVHGITCNGKTISITLGSGETATSAADKLLAALVTTTAGEFQEYAWVAVAGVITGTANAVGIPGTFTNASTSGTAGTLTNTMPANGPNFISRAANWSGATLPANGDDVYFTADSPSALHGLDWFRANSIVPASINLENFNGEVGLPAVRGGASSLGFSGASSRYPEYRKQFLELPAGSIVVNIGRGTSVPSRVHLDLAGTGTTVNVFGAGSVLVRGSTGHPKLAVTQGSVGVAVGVGETGGFLDVLIGDEGSPSENSEVVFGSGATVPKITNLSGKSQSDVACADLTMGLRAVQHLQTSGNLTAVVRGGSLIYSATGTLNVDASGDGVTVDLSQDPRPKTLNTASKILSRAKLLDPGDTRASGSTILFDDTSLPLSKLGPSVSITKA
jgi:hypothetical protein